MDQSIGNQFRATLSHLLAHEGRGAQSGLAGQQNIDRGYLNAIIKGRKPGSEEVRAKIASYFGMTYEDMLVLGRRILEEEGRISGEGPGSDQGPAIHASEEKGKNENIAMNLPRKGGAARSGISEKIMKVVAILESGTNYSVVLAELIDAFHEAVNTQKDNLRMRNQMKEMEARIASFEKSWLTKRTLPGSPREARCRAVGEK